MNILPEGWVYIGCVGFLILAAIGSAIDVIRRNPPEKVDADPFEENCDVKFDDVDDDD